MRADPAACWYIGGRTVASWGVSIKRLTCVSGVEHLCSYRESHLGAGKARSYDEDLWDPYAAKGLDWEVERRLLIDILSSPVADEIYSVADFACGTGRVLEFLSSHFPSATGIDISPEMLSRARLRCPRATLILGDVTADPALAHGPFDLITAFRFFLNAEPTLQSEVLTWMRNSLRPGGMVVANFHLNPASLRGCYLRLRTSRSARPRMMSVREAGQLFEDMASPSVRSWGTASSPTGGTGALCSHRRSEVRWKSAWPGPARC